MEGKTFKEVYLCQQKAISHDGQISRASPITSLQLIKNVTKKLAKFLSFPPITTREIRCPSFVTFREKTSISVVVRKSQKMSWATEPWKHQIRNIITPSIQSLLLAWPKKDNNRHTTLHLQT